MEIPKKTRTEDRWLWNEDYAKRAGKAQNSGHRTAWSSQARLPGMSFKNGVLAANEIPGEFILVQKAIFSLVLP